MTTITDTDFATLAKQGAWKVTLDRHSGSNSIVVTLQRSFTPNDRIAYMDAEGEANSLLSMAPATQPGTVWGTDSGSVGGHAGLTGGYMRLSKSGVSIRWANSIAKQLCIKVAS